MSHKHSEAVYGPLRRYATPLPEGEAYMIRDTSPGGRGLFKEIWYEVHFYNGYALWGAG